MFDVVVIGSANLDLVATAPRLPGPGETVLGTAFSENPGGKGLNQAVAAARAGAAVAMIGSVGDDAAGTILRAVAEANGVDVARLSVVADSPTGRAVITVDANAENSIVVVAGANGTVRFEALPATSVVLAQLEVPLDAVAAAFAAARAAGCTTVLNPAPVPGGGLPASLLALCDIVVPNEHELELIGGAEHLLAHGVGAVIVTLGAAGVRVTESTDSNGWSIGAFEVEPIDTTGAGDAFCGALAWRLAAGDDLRRAVTYAAAAGALATTVAGAVPSLASAAAIERLLSR